MRITVASGRVDSVRKGVLVYGALQGAKGFQKLVSNGPVPEASLRRLVVESGFQAAANETVWLPHGKRWVLVVGLGKAKVVNVESLRQFAATAVCTARTRGQVSVNLPVIAEPNVGTAAVQAQALGEGIYLGLYRYDQFRTGNKEEARKRIDHVTVVVKGGSDVAKAKKAIVKAAVIADAVMLARNLINGPSNHITPTYLANEARKLGRRPRIRTQVLPFSRLQKMGFGGIVGVAQGSAHPAQFIVLDYRPPRAKATLALCGKGITFDTGGISLKPAAKMELMKYDMSGAASVLGTVKAVASLKLPVRVVGIIAASENMPSGTAQKPGDILKTLSGKTVEVLNTDAEGRLVLSDCLHYAKRFKPDGVIDLATLTGACVVALGSEAIGLMANDDKLAKRIEEAGNGTHERVWRLPMWEEYGQLLRSDIADIKNIGNGEAGTITAGKFLETFIEGEKWAHLDIAGTAWTENGKPYVPKGAVGIGVRLLVNLIENWK